MPGLGRFAIYTLRRPRSCESSAVKGKNGGHLSLMKIAQVAPLHESVPPHGYGGTERVVSDLTEELVRQGAEVPLFASGDSKTAARLIPISPRSLRLGKAIDSLAHHIVLLEEIFQRLDQFDIVHFHIDYLHFPLSRR